ncbi:MAG: nucleotidyltransferase family protein [Candidatus Sulfopaludibacter sp.]|nr:nucleotidyltransferase family protein [Candidatus Sulfopaludibacter sp.]
MDSGRPEHALLLLGARRQLSAEESAEFSNLIAEPLDWRLLLQMADRHRILALLYASLEREGCLNRVPPPVLESLCAAVRLRVARSMALNGELARILETFEKLGIPAMPCKGPAVAMAAYGSISFRSFCDLDILVPESHLSLGSEALSALGYRPALRFTAEQERSYVENECAIQFRNESGLVVELHWRFCERNASVDLPVAAFWHRATRIALPGYEASTLATEDLLLYLCVHGAKHCWERIEWITCLAELIRVSPSLNWPAVLQRAESLGILRLLDLGLYLAQSMGAQLPGPAAGCLESDSAARRLATRVHADLFATPSGQSHYQLRASRYLFMMRSRERWADRARILFFSAIRPPHPEANEWMQLPPKLAFLHRIFRPVRLLTEYSVVAWRHYVR